MIATNQLPKMVRVTLSTGKANARIQPSDIVTRVVSIPAMVVPADSQFAPPVPGVPGVPPPDTYPPGTYPPGTVPPGGAYTGGPGMGYPGGGPGQPSCICPVDRPINSA